MSAPSNEGPGLRIAADDDADVAVVDDALPAAAAACAKAAPFWAPGDEPTALFAKVAVVGMENVDGSGEEESGAMTTVPSTESTAGSMTSRSPKKMRAPTMSPSSMLSTVRVVPSIGDTSGNTDRGRGKTMFWFSLATRVTRPL
jgi:hypothetical protein